MGKKLVQQTNPKGLKQLGKGVIGNLKKIKC